MGGGIVSIGGNKSALLHSSSISTVSWDRGGGGGNMRSVGEPDRPGILLAVDKDISGMRGRVSLVGVLTRLDGGGGSSRGMATVEAMEAVPAAMTGRV